LGGVFFFVVQFSGIPWNTLPIPGSNALTSVTGFPASNSK